MPHPVYPVVTDDSHQSIGWDDEQQNWLLPVGKIFRKTFNLRLLYY